MNPHRELDEIQTLKNRLDIVENNQKKSGKGKNKMDEKEFTVAMTTRITTGCLLAVLGIAAACTYSSVNTNHSQIEIAKFTAEKSKADADKAMFDYTKKQLENDSFKKNESEKK